MRKSPAQKAGEAETPRICLLTETFYPVVGGGETHARLLAGELNSGGMNTFVLTRRSQPGLPASDAVGGVPIRRVPPSGMKSWGKYAMVPFVLWELARMRHKYDLIYVCGFRVLGAPAVLASRVFGKICVLRAEAEGEMSGAYASVHRRLPTVVSAVFSAAIRMRNCLLRRGNAFVSISRPITSELLRCGVAGNRVFPISNGVDARVFRPVPPETKLALREKLGLPQGTLTVYAGKLNRGKGLDYLVAAWTRILQSQADAHLVLVGSGDNQFLSCEDQLRHSVRERGLGSRIIFAGYVDNVHEYLQAADLFVLPSEAEGLPMSLLEAMSCGLPVIASRVGGIPDCVRHLDNGVLVEAADPQGLADGIIDLLGRSGLSRSVAERGKETVRRHYSIQAVADRHRELFAALCSRKPQADERREAAV